MGARQTGLRAGRATRILLILAGQQAPGVVNHDRVELLFRESYLTAQKRKRVRRKVVISASAVKSEVGFVAYVVRKDDILGKVRRDQILDETKRALPIELVCVLEVAHSIKRDVGAPFCYLSMIFANWEAPGVTDNDAPRVHAFLLEHIELFQPLRPASGVGCKLDAGSQLSPGGSA